MEKIKVGDEVMVHERYHSFTGVVTKVGRVWITVVDKSVQGHPAAMKWSLRRDDQTDGSGFTHNAHFYTMTQWAEKQERDNAHAWLRSQGISLSSWNETPWRGREVELVKLIRPVLTPEETS